MRHEFFGATVAGPCHRAERRPNEDSWLGVRGAFGTLVVVSDGMGSLGQARLGARMACQAVLDAVRQWHKSGAGGLGELLARVEPAWRARIAPWAAHDCGATCLFALAQPGGQVHVAGLGDGMALSCTSQGLEWIVGPRADGFCNETAVLGQGLPWTTRSFPSAGGDVVVLATDGVADDLLPERAEAFVEWLVGSFAPLAPSRRWRALQHELREWPTPHHTDDKTLVVLTQRETVLA